MKALLLVGGYGTRLRPLTVSCPKSALAKVGVKEIILAINYQGDIIQNDLAQIEKKYNVKVIYVKEEVSLGTAGPLKLSEKLLKQDNEDNLIFVFNSDIICDFPLAELLSFHKTHKKKATIALAQVEDPSRFGVAIVKEQRIQRFVEKPKEYIGNTINAGLYLLDTSVIDMIPERHCMIEKEVFPQLAQKQQLYSITIKNDFWFDLGKPQDYILGQHSYLKYYQICSSTQKCVIKGNCLIDPSATIGEYCHIGPNVVIGPNVKIGPACRLQNCSIFANGTVGQGCYIDNSIISWKCNIGNWVRIEGLTGIAEQVTIKDEVKLTKCMILSFKTINETHENQILM